VLAAHPEVAEDVFNAFARAKELYVDQLKGGRIEKPDATDEVYRRVMELIGDPLPYGIEPNRKAIEELMAHAVAQKIIERPMSIDELFVPSTRTLVAATV
jgi:4,5-dihydroxyphthalate decarboxylase